MEWGLKMQTFQELVNSRAQFKHRIGICYASSIYFLRIVYFYDSYPFIILRASDLIFIVMFRPDGSHLGST